MGNFLNIPVDDSAALLELSRDVPAKIKSESFPRKMSKGGMHVRTTVKASEETFQKIFQMKNEIAERFSAIATCENRKTRTSIVICMTQICQILFPI